MRQWLNDNPFLAALIVIVLVAVPGYVRVESNVDAVERLVAQDQAGRLERCQNANDSRMQIRQTFHDVFAQLASLGADPTLIARLNGIVPTAEDSDIDCDGSGTIDEGDYS